MRAVLLTRPGVVFTSHALPEYRPVPVRVLHTYPRYKKQRPALKKPEPDAHAPLKDAEQGLMLGSLILVP